MAQTQVISVADVEVPQGPRPGVRDSSCNLIERLSPTFQV